MPKFYSLEQPPQEKVKKITEKLHEYPNLKPRLTFLFPINENRKSALEMIETGKLDPKKVTRLLESNDFIEKQAGLYLSKNMSDISKENNSDFLLALGKLSDDENPDIRKAVAQALSNQGENALPILEKLSKDEKADVRKAVAQALSNQGEKALPILEKMSDDEKLDIREAVAQALGNQGEKALPILEKLSRDEEWSVQIAAAQARINIIVKTKGEKALPILEKMSEDKRPDIRKAVAQALSNQSEKALPILEKLSEDEIWWVRIAAAQARINIIVKTKGEKALPILEKLSNDKRPEIREAVAQALGNQGEKALPILEKLSKDEKADVRKAVVQALSNQGEKALPILEKMSEDKEYWVREKAAWTLGNQGEKALPILEKMSEDKRSSIREMAAQALGNQGEKALPILEKLSEDKDRWIREVAARALRRIKRMENYEWLLATKKPLFATPYTQELSETILKIQEIVKKLQEEFKDDFVGLTIFGSAAKGYFAEESDLDWGIIAKNRKVLEKFKTMAEPLYLCHEHYASLNDKYQIQNNESILFYGLFFGDYNKLLKIQKDLLERIDQEKWDEIRKDILKKETDLLKAQKRFELKEQELEDIKQIVALLRVPPPYQETLSIIQERAKNTIRDNSKEN